jgi:ABC-type nitrate/sulfonate/bicarbonate transport system permease component
MTRATGLAASSGGIRDGEPTVGAGGPEAAVPIVSAPPVRGGWLRAIWSVRGDVLWPLVALAVLIGIWQVLAVSGAFPAYIFASPASVARYIPANLPKLLGATAVTLKEMGLGYLLALAGGVVLGVLITQIKILEKALLPLLIITQVIPSVAIAPMLVMMLGFGSAPKVVTAAIVAFFPILVNTIAGLRSLDNDTRDLSRVLRVSRLQYLRRFAMPAAMPYIFAGARIGITLAIIGAVVGEFVTSNAGLGYLVLQGTNAFDAQQVFSTLVLLAVTGILAFSCVRVVERLTIPWANHLEDES